jgi:antitoxin (DNA-binding transcriptional repressor) of toxin-antitoxin stability system
MIWAVTSCTGASEERAAAVSSDRMSREISQRELRNDSGSIMRALTQGETFIITRHGQPVGELTPLRRHRFVRTEAAVELFRSAAPVDYDRLRRDLDQIADQHIAPRA